MQAELPHAKQEEANDPSIDNPFLSTLYDSVSVED